MKFSVHFRRISHFFNKYRDFFDAEALYYASSLSFYTLLVLVPLSLVFITLLTYLPGSQETITSYLDFFESNLLPMQSEYLNNFVTLTLDNRLEIGIVGVGYAMIVSMFFFYDYDYVVAKIFGAPKKGFMKTFWTYLLFMVLAPFVWVGFLFINTFLYAQVDFVFSFIPLGQNELLSVFATWLSFTVAMKLSISIKIRWKTLLLASFIIAFIWSLLHSFFLWYVVHNQMYSTIYGSFASIFFFFVWVYLSWIIYLYGLKLCKILHLNDQEITPSRKL